MAAHEFGDNAFKMLVKLSVAAAVATPVLDPDRDLLAVEQCLLDFCRQLLVGSFEIEFQFSG